jgi:eukaryotic-like serine/threonine-protein kinase
VNEARKLVRTLTLPYDSVRTLYEGDCEVRLYRNEITGALQVGKRLSTLGLEQTVAVREGTLLKRITHANIVDVSDVTRVDGYDPLLEVIELIMPYYERGSIFDCFERGERFSVAEAIEITSMALCGLAELHEVHGILHRDIKSPNIFLADDGRALIGDLGVAMPLDGEVEALDSPRLWTPPETYTLGTVDRTADLYQLGLVLHELTSGPFDYGAEPKYLLDRIATRLLRGSRGVVGSDLDCRPWVPAGVRRVIRKATALSPEDRYPSARAMNDALRRARVVDWTRVVDEPDFKRWEGTTHRHPDRVYRVEATRRKRGGWTVTARQRLNAWRRVAPDAIATELDDRSVRDLFDAAVESATSL